MLQFITKRILITIPVLLGVTIIIFTMMYFTPGDPARLILGDGASKEDVKALRDEMGLNDSYFKQYIDYLARLFKGDLGRSYVTGTSVAEEILGRIQVTGILALFSVLFAVIVGIPIGVISAVKQYSSIDNFIRVFALAGISLPNFWLALLLVLFFAVYLGWLPASGLYGPLYYIMPILSISVVSIATIARMTRSSMLEVIRQDYIRTARAKGQMESVIIFKHALKNALIPIITVIGIQFASLFSGAVVNEQIFSLPGLGKLMVDAIKARNYPVVQGGVLVIAASMCLVNLIIDLCYAIVDPRIKTQYNQSQRKQ
jgi:peptide/nickel transport system permease protein